MTAKALGLEISLLPIDLLHGEQLDHEFLEIHIEHTLPTKQKDTLVLSDRKTIESSNISLYYSILSPPCRSVLLTAQALHLKFDLQPIDLLHDRQLDPEFKKINFQHTLPTIKEDNFVLWDRMITESTKVSPLCRSILLTLSVLNIGLDEIPIEFIEHASDENTSEVRKNVQQPPLHKYFLKRFLHKNYLTDSSCSSDEMDKRNNKKTIHFPITFSSDEWKYISPRPKSYIEKNGSRDYLVLTPFEWSNVVQEHFYLHTGLPCPISFKKARVSEYGENFVTVYGRCKECNSILQGYVKEVPSLNARVVMQCSYVGHYDTLHSKKRRLMGSEMNRVLNALNNQKENASVYIRSEVNRLMKEGFDKFIDSSSTDDILQCDMHNDYNMSETVGNCFQEWASIIADNLSVLELLLSLIDEVLELQLVVLVEDEEDEGIIEGKNDATICCHETPLNRRQRIKYTDKSNEGNRRKTGQNHISKSTDQTVPASDNNSRSRILGNDEMMQHNSDLHTPSPRLKPLHQLPSGGYKGHSLHGRGRRSHIVATT
ncbi:hypothetical protein ACI65C_001397 [Semiaphis heraclei]